MGAKLQDGKLIPSPYIWKCPVEAQRGLGGPADGHDQEVGTCKHLPTSPRTTLTTSRAASESPNGTHTPKRLPHHHPPSHTTHHPPHRTPPSDTPQHVPPPLHRIHLLLRPHVPPPLPRPLQAPPRHGPLLPRSHRVQRPSMLDNAPAHGGRRAGVPGGQ